jgi:hypothetical protein
VNRDDFPNSLKQVLAARVGHRCSNPDCQALTSGPQVDEGKSLNLGVAAHIAAASPGGPRYDPLMTPEQRTAITNGVWLCQNCAKLVDNDAARFSSELLSAWKLVAEHHALYHIGRTASDSGRLGVQDKYVSYEYIEKSGLIAEMQVQGYRLYWAHSHKQPTMVEFEGWEEVVVTEDSGQRVRYKVRDPQCEYLILLRKMV